MKEIKSTIIGVLLISLGAFFVYSNNVQTNEYLYGSFGLIAFGIYLLFTTAKNRGAHFRIIISRLKKKIDEKK